MIEIKQEPKEPQVKLQDNLIPQNSCNLTPNSPFKEVKIQTTQNFIKQQESQTLYVYHQKQQKTKSEKAKKIQKKYKAKKTKKIVRNLNKQNKKTQECLNRVRKCKDNRTGKYNQSLAQRFIKKVTGYHYCKNFNQFYQKNLFLYLKQAKQNNPFKYRQINLIEPKIKWCYEMDVNQIGQFMQYIMKNLVDYVPYMKKYKEKQIFDLFEGEQLAFFELFFKVLIRKLYQILIFSTHRKYITQMEKKQIESLDINKLMYQGLDIQGQKQIVSAFDQAFIKAIFQYQFESFQNIELLKLKLQKLSQVQCRQTYQYKKIREAKEQQKAEQLI